MCVQRCVQLQTLKSQTICKQTAPPLHHLKTFQLQRPAALCCKIESSAQIAGKLNGNFELVIQCPNILNKPTIVSVYWQQMLPVGSQRFSVQRHLVLFFFFLISKMSFKWTHLGRDLMANYRLTDKMFHLFCLQNHPSSKKAI